MRKPKPEFLLAVHTVERALELLRQIPDGVFESGPGYTPQRNLYVAKSDLVALLRMVKKE